MVQLRLSLNTYMMMHDYDINYGYRPGLDRYTQIQK